MIYERALFDRVARHPLDQGDAASASLVSSSAWATYCMVRTRAVEASPRAIAPTTPQVSNTPAPASTVLMRNSQGR